MGRGQWPQPLDCAGIRHRHGAVSDYHRLYAGVRLADPPQTVADRASFIGIVGLGQTFVIIGGGVDLSIPYVVNAAGIVLTILTSGQNGPLIWVIPVLIVLAALVGLINGVGIAMLGISPI